MASASRPQTPLLDALNLSVEFLIENEEMLASRHVLPFSMFLAGVLLGEKYRRALVAEIQTVPPELPTVQFVKQLAEEHREMFRELLPEKGKKK